METPLRPGVLELIRLCETLAGQDIVLTVRENEAVARCARDLEKKILPARLETDQPIPYPISHR